MPPAPADHPLRSLRSAPARPAHCLSAARNSDPGRVRDLVESCAWCRTYVNTGTDNTTHAPCSLDRPPSRHACNSPGAHSGASGDQPVRSFRSTHPSHLLIRQRPDRFTCACSAPDRHPTRPACNPPAIRIQDATNTVRAERAAHHDLQGLDLQGLDEGLAPQHRALLSYDRSSARLACHIPGAHPGAPDEQSFPAPPHRARPRGSRPPDHRRATTRH